MIWRPRNPDKLDSRNKLFYSFNTLEINQSITMRWIDSFVICVLLPFVFFWFLISLAKDEFSVVRKHHPSPHFSALTCCLQLFRDFYFHHYHLLVLAVEFVSVHIHTYRQQRHIDNFERVYFHLPVVCLIVSVWIKIGEYKYIGIENIWE